MHDEPTPDRSTDDVDDSTLDVLGVELAAAADGIEVGDPERMLASVHTIATRRRRRRNTVVGLAAAGTLVVSGAVVANLVDGNGGDDLIVSAPATEAPTTDAAEVDDDTPPATVIVDAPGNVTEVVTGEAIPVRLVAAEATEVVDPGVTVDAASSGQQQLLAWNGGFLSLRTSYPPQPLPTELPQEIIDQFPPEVVELFADGLPATIQEATQVLQDAGLLDEVSAIVTSNSEVYDAIYGVPGAPETTARFSPDGVEWSDVDAEFPMGSGYWNYVQSTGDRLVLVMESNAVSAGPEAVDGPSLIEVYSSTDLVDWDVQQVPVQEAPTELGPGESFRPYVSGLAVTDAGFLVSTMNSTDLDVVELLEPALRDRIRASSGGVGVGYGDDGVQIELYPMPEPSELDEPAVTSDVPSPASEPSETLSFTWEELGLDGPPDHNEQSVYWVSTWDGEPTRIDVPSASWVVSVGDEYVEIGPVARRSVDGVEWVPIDLPLEGYLDAVIETDDGVAIRMSDTQGIPRMFVGELASGEWTELEQGDLPANVYTEAFGSGAFVVAAHGGDVTATDPTLDSIGSRQSAEVDGYRYELEVVHTSDEYSVTYTLTDIATGEVVVTESADGLSGEEDPFLYVEDGFGDGLTLLDPETGEPLVTIPYEAMTQEIVNADGTVTDVSDQFVDSGEASIPVYWVIASVDTGWIIEQVSDGTDGSRWSSGVAAVGDVVLLAWSDGTFTRLTAS